MNLAVLCKRQYMHKDLLDDRYGRFWEIPRALAAKGHSVHGYTLSYLRKNEGDVAAPAEPAVEWSSFNAGRIKAVGLLRYAWRVSAAFRRRQPRIVWACSDSLYVIVGQWLAQRHDAVLVADLYDNFEAYDAARIPFVRYLYRRALRKAGLITVVSDRLREKILRDVRPQGEVRVLVNGIPAGMFVAMDKVDCRRQVGIPAGVPVIGCTGVLTRRRGGEFILTAYRALRRDFPDLRLLLAGDRDGTIDISGEEGIVDCGDVPQSRLPSLLACMDMAVIANNKSAFSDYTFSQRLYETISCGVPVLASRVGAVADVLQDYPGCLFEAGDVADFVRKAGALLQNPMVPDISCRSWPDLAVQFEEWLAALES